MFMFKDSAQLEHCKQISRVLKILFYDKET